jgi:hypothetical protein
VNSSTLDSLVSLNAEQRLSLLESLTDEQSAALLYDWPLWAREEQLEPVGSHSIWLVLAGRGFGKTRLGAEWVREQVKTRERVNLIGQDAAAVRSLMIEGESGIMAVCPPWERPEYVKSQRLLRWPNGAISECRSGEDPEGVRGLQHEALWCDELAAWQYVDDTWDMAVLGLRLGDNPRALITTTPKPIPLLRDLIEDPTVLTTKGATYANRDNLAPTFFSQLITKYEGTRLGRQELDAELLLDEGLAYRVSQGVHIVPPMTVPVSWERFESMDYGGTHPTAWPVYAVDWDGNVIVFDMYYSPGLVSDHAAAILERRRKWKSSVCYGPADIKHTFPKLDIHGKEMTIETEFFAYGLSFVMAQQDRRAGYMRVAEMLKRDEARRFPEWHPMAGQPGAPRLFILDTDELEPMVRQLRDAPLESPESSLSRFPGEAVDQAWEGEHGHAHAALRYGLMSRPSPSRKPEPWDGTPPHLRPQWTDAQALRAESLQQARRRWERPPGRRTERV